jgi:hypothetical protein
VEAIAAVWGKAVKGAEIGLESGDDEATIEAVRVVRRRGGRSVRGQMLKKWQTRFDADAQLPSLVLAVGLGDRGGSPTFTLLEALRAVKHSDHW